MRAGAGVRRRWVRGTLLVTLAVATSPLIAQRSRFPRSDKEPDFSQFNVGYDGRFTFVRLRYTPLVVGWGGGGGYFDGRNYQWDHDYPRAEQHLTAMLDELTAIVPHGEGTNIFSAEDAALFRYPVAYMSEPGYWQVSETEATNLRNYLLKGGFLIVDDFQGDYQWFNFERTLRQVLPNARLVQLDPSHPIFNAFFAIEALDQVHPYSGAPAAYYGVFEDNDPRRRLLMIVNYNNDIGESWEWSNTGLIPISLTNEAYRLGVNYIVYAMTH